MTLRGAASAVHCVNDAGSTVFVGSMVVLVPGTTTRVSSLEYGVVLEAKI